MYLNDTEILELCKKGMITPFSPSLVRESNDRRVISWGLSSFGYDIRLSPSEFWVFQHVPGTIVDPKEFNKDNLQRVPLQSDEKGDFFVIPGNSYGLGVSLELFAIPEDVIAVCLGKSTIVRVGVIPAITPLEPGWTGHITLEFSNSSPADCRIYANEGVAQLLFARGNLPSVTYSTRSGKYMNQPEQVVVSRV